MNFFGLLSQRVAKLLMVLGMFLVNSVFADNCGCSPSKLELGANYTRMNLKVGGHRSYNSNLWGVQGSYEYKPVEGFYAGVRLAFKTGTPSHGHYLRTTTYVDAQERVGYTLASCNDDLTVTGFTGFGYRYLRHRLKEFQTLSNVSFNYNEFYVPVGILSEYSFCSSLSFGINCIWMPQVFPTVEIRPVKGVNWSLKSTYGNFLVEALLTSYLSENVSLILKPFYERWENGRATARDINDQKLGLQKNRYNFYGVELNFAYVF